MFIKHPTEMINHSQKKRAKAFLERIDCEKVFADGAEGDGMIFSPPFPHGEEGSRQGYVVMTLVGAGDDSFCHASDIQCLNNDAVDWILDKKPETVLVSGPAYYRGEAAPSVLQTGRFNMMRLAQGIPNLIIDHHLLREEDYLKRLEAPLAVALSRENSILTAAQYMMRPPLLLEAKRRRLYKQYPVEEKWVRDFLEGEPYTMGRIDEEAERLERLEAGDILLGEASD